MKKVLDFLSIFDLFPLDKIETNFVLLINAKINEIRYTTLEEKEENLKKVFKIFENIFRLNCSNKDLNFNFPIKVVQINFNFASKFYFYLLGQKDLFDSIMESKDSIIDYFIEQTRKKSENAESLISLLQLSPDKKFSIILLNKMNYIIMNEDDFYQIEENDKFHFFELFLERIENLNKNEFVSEGDYLIKSLEIKTKLLYMIYKIIKFLSIELINYLEQTMIQY